MTERHGLMCLMKLIFKAIVCSVICALFSVFVLCSFLFSPQTCFAQEIGSKRSLFNSAARSRADEKASSRGSSRSRRSQRTYAAASISRDVADELRLDTVDDIILSPATQTRLFSEYRGFAYLSYVRDLLDIRELEELESGNAAERLFFYQTAKSVSEYLLTSPLEVMYRRMLGRIKSLGQYTHVRVSRGGNGKVNITQGQDKGRRLLEFGIHASARSGIEPRIRLSDELVLRYDVMQSDALIEFSYDF